MEEETHRRRDMSREAHKRKRRRASSDSSPSIAFDLGDSNALFSLLLAAVSKVQISPSSSSPHLSMIKKCLGKWRLALLSDSGTSILPSPQALPVPLLSLLPVVIKSKFCDIACIGLEVVGAAALRSLEMNEQIALDSEILNGVIWGLRSSSKRLKMAACSAVLDLSSSSVGRERLLQSSTLETLMGDGSTIGHAIVCKEEDFPVTLLDAIVNLVNDCNNEQLESIPQQSMGSLLVLLKELLPDLKSRILLNNVSEANQNGEFHSANIRVCDLAECIFRLSISCQFANLVPGEAIRRRIFGSDEVNFEKFLVNHWERSPHLIDRTQVTVNEESSFSSYLEPLKCEGAVPQFLTSMLQHMVSCPPIASDELDILNYLKQERDQLSIPIIYQQDIRVLKVERHLNGETHFFPKSWGSCIHKPYIFSPDDIAKCEEALEKGYSVAIRGMEFRFESIGAITEGLASLFGQPSVGANFYLTPPNSQGLARHYDDHCVFVCQLVGTKQWTISPPMDNLLPRLYEPISGTCSSEASSGAEECLQITLKEGDVLYIPRGYFHEAHSTDGGFSLHLTLAIEVEAPLEWEGFMHSALNYWSWKNLNQEPVAESLDFVMIKLLHVMIGLLGDSDPTFRKACLVGSISRASNMSNLLEQTQRAIFSELIEKINNKSKFTELLKALEAAVHANRDPFRRLGWLHILDQEEQAVDGRHGQMLDLGAEDLLSLCYRDREKAEAAFSNFKSQFCKEAKFEHGVSSYCVVLEKYRKVRKQYLNGMLSLHCKLNSK